MKKSAGKNDPYDLGVLCGNFLSMKDSVAIPEKNVFLGVKDGTIAYVGPENRKSHCRVYVDAGDQLVMPGLVNSHSHLPMHLFRGLSDDESFDVWLFKNILPLEAKLVSPEFVKLGTELWLLEALSFGITSTYDTYYFEDEIAEVCDRAGIRALLGENFSSFVPPDDKEQRGDDLKIIERMVERYAGHPRIRPMVGAHAPYSCTDERLKEARDLALKYDLEIGIHVSESKGEVERSQKEFGKNPVERLHDLGVSEAKCIYAHCVHVTDGDIALMKKQGVKVSHNPEANMKLGVGIAPVRKLLDAGIVLGLGTDGVGSNNDLNLWKEMDTAAKLTKLSLGDSKAISAADLLRMATSQGAQALGFCQTGQLREGYRADFLILGLDAVNFYPTHGLLSSLVNSTSGREVESVYCEGKLLYCRGEYMTLDKEAIQSRCRKYLKKHF